MKPKKETVSSSSPGELEKKLAEVTLELERKNRDLEIEASLERVRARAMAMQSSNELADLVTTLFKELAKLDFALSWCMINIIDGDSLSNTIWAKNADAGGVPERFHMKFEGYPFHNAMWDAWKGKLARFVYTLEGAEKKIYDEYLFNQTEFSRLPETVKAGMRATVRYVASFSFSNFGGLQTVGDEPLSDASLDILSRFGKVFDLTYTRLNDLKQAEAQAKEAQIELALERVRARTMAMQHSDELAETAYILFQQFRELGENPDQATIGIINEAEGVIEYWVTLYGSKTNKVYKFPIDEPNVTNKIYKAWKAQEKSLVIDLSGKALHNFMKFRAGMGGAAINTREKRRIINVAFFSKGLINVQSAIERSVESLRLLERFAKVFEQTYTRFLDLQKAEAQARESQIQLALERVRAKTMAMQQSTELAETASQVSQQLHHLGLSFSRVGFYIWQKDTSLVEGWTSNGTFDGLLPPLVLPYMEDDGHLGIYEAAQRGEHSFEQVLGGDELKRHYEWLLSQPSVWGTLKTTDENAFVPMPIQYKYAGIFKQGYLLLMATEPQPEAGNLLERFALVFEQTYTRFLDLQKAEAQVREAQIEAALEKVRSRSLAMHQTDELREVVTVVFDKLGDLGIVTEDEAASIVIFTESTKDLILWNAIPGQLYSKSFHIPYYDTPVISSLLDAKSTGADFFERNYTSEEKDHFWKWAVEYSDYKNIPDDRKKHILSRKYFACSVAYAKNSAILVSSYNGKLLSEKESEILKRFARVFEQAYVRFLDLHKAEAQAREAQIELGLERIRARAMAMQNSDELNELIGGVFNELKKLDFVVTRCRLWIFDPVTLSGITWQANQETQANPLSSFIKYNEYPFYLAALKAWKERRLKFVYELMGSEKKSWDEFLFNETELSRLPEVVKEGMRAPERVLLSASFSNFGAIQTGSLEPLSDEQMAILSRFVKVFDMTYRRFNDLKQAEAQAREAQIQLALERVRARTMAMQKSDELAETVSLLFKQLLGLGIRTEQIRTCGIATFDDNKPVGEQWITETNGEIIPQSFMVPYDEAPAYKSIYKGWKDGDQFMVIHLEGKKLKEHLEYLAKGTTVPTRDVVLPQQAKEIFNHVMYFSQGCLFIITKEALPEYHEVFKRFGAVFQQSYTRFLDLQKAEMQAREAQIEVALEKVRGKAMAMHNSNDLSSAVSLVFTELKKLGIKPIRCGVGLFTKDAPRSVLYTATISNDSDTLDLVGWVDMVGHPVLEKIYESWLNQEDYLPVLNGKELKTYYKKLSHGLHIPPSADGRSDEKQYGHFLAFPEGMLNAWAERPYTEPELKILDRFKKIISLTFRRYLDLKQAEEQACEARIETALERVRSRTMGMQKSEELAEVIQVVHDQLHQLNFNIDVANFVLNYNERDDFDLWLAVHGQRYATKIHVPYFDHPIFNRFNEAKEKGLDFFADSFTFDEKNTFFRHFFENTPGVPEERKAAVFGAPGYARSTVFMKNIALSIQNYAAVPYSDNENATLMRFGKVFEQTYTRFNDLKQAEEAAREAKIELALERVRARTMAMYHSEELALTAAVLFEQLSELGDEPARISIGIPDERNDMVNFWATDQQGDQINISFTARISEQTTVSKMYGGWKEKIKSLAINLEGEELSEWVRFCREEMGIIIRDDLLKKQRVHTVGYFSYGWINYTTHDSLSAAIIKVLERFAAVFEQTYRRFLDLQKAEAQTKEAKIEAALERVRSRTMAMHDSRGVADTSATMFQELVKLGVEPTVRCGVSIINSVNDLEVWTASLKNDGSITLNYGHLDMTAHPLFMHVFTEWQRKESSTTFELTGDLVRSYFQALNDAPGYPLQYPMDALPEKWGINAFFFREGCLFAFTSEPLSPEMSQVFKRFAGVFGQTYRRYLDLQKAEEQAREAKIETSLERVRSKAMAMRSSEDLADAIGVFYHELGLLSATPRRCGLGLIDKETHLVELSTMNTIGQGNSIEIIGELKLAGHPVLEGIYDNWLLQKEYHPVLRGNDVKAYYQVIQSQISYPDYPYDTVQYGYYFFFRDGGIFAWTETELPEAEIQIYRRFNSVISLTYRRYKDIREAEEQAREAQIEASLERVRSKAMAMRNSNDLLTAASTVFTELQNLGINQIRSGVGLIAKDFHKAKVYSATSSQSAIDLSLMGEVTLYGHPVFEQQYQSWLKRENYFVALEGAALASYYKILSAGLNADLGITVKKHQKEYGHWFMFSEGFLYAWSDKEYTDAEIKILERFKNVMELTIRRYIELQKSETQAREAIRQASLDRVRAEIASMRTTGDLERITPLIWNELTILGVPFIRCGVFIMDEQLQQIHTYLSTPDGKAIASFQLPFNDNSGNGVSQAALRGWRQKQAVAIHWTAEEFKSFSHSLAERGEITSEEIYLTQRLATGLDLHFFPFLQGMLYAGNTEPLSDEDKDLVQSLADAFSTAYARYEDFSSLELAKQEVERTLTDLKAAQTKLIQSEKMASLGELTAGIAHEIQNPLNFVNNFSEVNQEMIDELEEELNAGNIEEALAIAIDIKQNEQKINHHGKRADAIVKGMLQHSRTGGGEKQPTNINSVADEYMRLSYHGLRAKDKAFNAEMITHFDPDLPRINVIGQDIGRVLLNLFNNAFYAVNQKKKAVGDGFNPEVSVATLTENRQVIIKVKDNGMGMSDQVKEKIMQPFFTTKPTGEGTGLGLSLTYDMVVKGHGGSILVDTKEGEFTEFTVTLPL